MATVSIALPVDPLQMATRRPPLANNPNAVNSPYRGTLAGSIKRTRAQVGDPRDAVHGQPPYKKHIIDLSDDGVENVDPRRRDGVPAAAQDKLEDLFAGRRKPNPHPNPFEQRLIASKEKEKKPQKPAGDGLDHLRQWAHFYGKQFPTYVFYFESVPDDARARVLADARSLGAKEVKFFSKEVTHVITTRPIPADAPEGAVEDRTRNDTSQARAIKSAGFAHEQRRTTDLLNANLQRRGQHYHAPAAQDVDPRKVLLHNADVLSRAKAMDIKIWALEKLQRMMKTLREIEIGEYGVSHDSHIHVAPTKTTATTAADADLEQLLRHEKINGPADRDMTVAAQDMITLKGCFLYIHDMDERTKPVMVRDYAKPAVKEQGKWPQFRLTPSGRCPFLEDPAHTKKLQQEEAMAAKAEQELASQRRTRAASIQPRVLTEREANLRRSPRKSTHHGRDDLAKPLDPPKIIPAKRQSSMDGMPNLFGSAQQSIRGLPRMIGGEPVASGMQQSNVTSAIRSQIVSSAAISSTAAGMPKRVGDSKEVSALKRKVLERGASVTSNHSMPSSYMNDVRGAINENNDPPPRAAKRRALETLGVVHEDDEDAARANRRPSATRKQKSTQKEPKPGYCENCRDKFADFDEHINSRKHRKFAMTPDNWAELDVLLSQLKRPHKVV